MPRKVRTQAKKMNLFQRAKRRVVPEETPVKRAAYTVKTGRDFDGAVSRFMKARDALEEAKTDHEFTRNELMDISIDKWAEASKTEGKPLGSMELHTKDGAKVNIIPTNRFKTMTEEQAIYYKRIGYEWAIEEETTYSFNQRILAKHMEVISRLIETCDEIPEADRERLFTAKTKYFVNKDNIKTDPRFSKTSLIRDLGRVFMLKCPKLS